MNPHSTDKTKQKVPSKMNRQRDALRLLSATANAPTPHSNGENARSHGFPGSPTCSNEDTSRGIGLVPLGPAVWIMVHWLYHTHEKMNQAFSGWYFLCFVWIGWVCVQPRVVDAWIPFLGGLEKSWLSFLRGENCVRWICSVKTPTWKEVVKAAACEIDWISITVALKSVFN